MTHLTASRRLPRLRIGALVGLAPLLLAFSLGAQALAPTVPLQELEPGVEHRRATRLITHFLGNYHYKKAPLDDALSSQIFERYIESLDPNRSYFTASDIAVFKRSEAEFDDFLRQADLSPIYEIFRRYRLRLEERVRFAVSLLEGDFNFDLDETYMFRRDEAPWPTDRAQLDELWRKRVKNDALSLKLSGKDVPEIKDLLRKRYEGMERRTAQLGSEDVFQIFINAYTTAIDPHTSYFSPRTSENFKIRMSLSLEGIGAVLQSKDEFVLVREVVPGGPAAQSRLLQPEDRIIGVGQGEEEIVSVVGWRLDDVVDLIRGPKGSTVMLDVLPKGVGPDGPSKRIPIVRDTIKLEEQAAKSSVLDVEQEGAQSRIGIIDLPAFYMDFDARARGDEDYRSTTRDVRKLIETLTAEEDIAGLIIDLRGNGGGSLTEATDLTGLFIDRGPVVQVKSANGRVQLEEDSNGGVVYAGPLMVLVDRNSASASEIFAGAVQDYRRGIVVGEPTFGKGTVQHLVDLNRFDKSMEGELGQLKATIAQFFRVEGASTQHKGVVPDIIFPTAERSEEHGERALDNALPFARIQPAPFRPANTVTAFDELKTRHEARIKEDDAFAALLDQELAISEAADQDTLSLNEAVRRAELDQARDAQRERSNRLRVARGLEPISKEAFEEEIENADEIPLAEEEAEREAEDRALDVELREAANILADYVTLMQAKTTPSARLVDGR